MHAMVQWNSVIISICMHKRQYYISGKLFVVHGNSSYYLWEDFVIMQHKCMKENFTGNYTIGSYNLQNYKDFHCCIYYSNIYGYVCTL